MSDRCNFQFVHAGGQPEVTCLGKPLHDAHRSNNFELCRAIDMTKLTIVLQRMVDEGWLNKRDAELFDMQAGVLRAQLCTANNHAFARLNHRRPA